MQNMQPPAKASIGMDANLAAALGYVIGIIGIIVLCTEKENKWVKFHALQSLLFHVAIGVVFAVGTILFVIINLIVTFAAAGVATAAGNNAGGLLGVIILLFWGLFYIVVICVPFLILAANIVSAVKAYHWKVFRIPIVGKFAAQWSKFDEPAV